jgi:hypothetical protein
MPMKVDLSDPKEFTTDNIRRLIASGDNRYHSQIRVNHGGIAELSKSVGNDGKKKKWAFSISIFGAQSDKVGEAASQDEAWVKRIYDALRKNWPEPSSKHIDDF